MKIFQDPDNPEKIIVESYPCASRYIRIRDANGRPCKPWVIEEVAIIDARILEREDQRTLFNYRRWALPKAIKKAEELSLQEGML